MEQFKYIALNWKMLEALGCDMPFSQSEPVDITTGTDVLVAH